MSKKIAVVERSLQQDLVNVDRLSHLLSAEQDALKDRDAEHLQKVLVEKTQTLAAIEKNVKQRAAFMKALGFEASSAGFDALLQTFPAQYAEPLKQHWLSVETKLKACRQQNHVNGRIIGMTKSRVERMLGILRGQHNQSKIYGESGQTQAISEKHCLATA